LEGRGLKLERDLTLALFPLEARLVERAFSLLSGALLAHPLVRLLAGEPAILGSSVPRVAELDATLDPRAGFSGLDADGSQLAVIEAVKNGSPLLLVDAPPLTGRTQTAVNLAAEAAAQGHNVLFVSAPHEARAAVFGRLARAGLGHLCFEIPVGGRPQSLPP